MTSKTSFNSKGGETAKLNPEKAWLKESLMKFKLIPIILTVMYFLVNILPVLIYYTRFENIASYVDTGMRMMNILNSGIAIGAGVVAASTVFGYLHKSASVTDAHSRPLTRKSLFRASFTSGLIMILVPIIITGILYICVQGAHVSAVFDPETFSLWFSDESKIEGILTLRNAFGWMLGNFLMVVYSYSVSCFAGILAGTGVIQTLLSVFFLSLPAMMYSITQGYLSIYLKGYSSDFEGVKYLSPYVYLFSRGEYPLSYFSVAPFIYVAIMIILVFASLELYKRIGLENEENSIVVPYVSSALVVILTFISVSANLLISDTIFSSSESMLISLVIILLATAVSFPVFCMIADQTFRVFNRRNMKILGIFAVLMAATLMFTMFDITGYEKRIPKISDIKTIDIDGSSVFQDGSGKNEGIAEIDNPQTTDKIVRLHSAIISAENPEDPYENTSLFTVTYHLKNGKTIKRTYSEVPESVNKREYSNLYNDKYIRDCEKFNLSSLNKFGAWIELERYDDNGSIVYKVPKDLVSGLIEAANNDIDQWTAKGRYAFTETPEDYGSKGIIVRATNYKYDGKDDEKYINIDRNFFENDKNINEFILNHPELFTKANQTENNYY